MKMARQGQVPEYHLQWLASKFDPLPPPPPKEREGFNLQETLGGWVNWTGDAVGQLPGFAEFVGHEAPKVAGKGTKAAGGAAGWAGDVLSGDGLVKATVKGVISGVATGLLATGTVVGCTAAAGATFGALGPPCYIGGAAGSIYGGNWVADNIAGE